MESASEDVNLQVSFDDTLQCVENVINIFRGKADRGDRHADVAWIVHRNLLTSLRSWMIDAEHSSGGLSEIDNYHTNHTIAVELSRLHDEVSKYLQRCTAITSDSATQNTPTLPLYDEYIDKLHDALECAQQQLLKKVTIANTEASTIEKVRKEHIDFISLRAPDTTTSINSQVTKDNRGNDNRASPKGARRFSIDSGYGSASNLSSRRSSVDFENAPTLPLEPYNLGQATPQTKSTRTFWEEDFRRTTSSASVSTNRGQWQPSFIVGIDFGTTSTAVAYSEAPEWRQPLCIQRWPRPTNSKSQLDNKVATQVGYDGRGKLVNWGFLSGADGQEITLESEFKMYIDPALPDSNPTRPSHSEALKYYEDYMRSLHQYIETFFSSSFPGWQQRNVEFVFSIPTTWRSPGITATLQHTLAEVGFGNRSNRKLNIHLTEAEAAAANAAKQSFRVGDMIMVVDTGGATTNINVLELVESSAQSTKLTALIHAEGVNVGSTWIDEQVRQLLRTELQGMGVAGDDHELQWLAVDMLQATNFEAIKCNFEGELDQLQQTHFFTVPIDRAAVNIHDRGVAFSGTQLKSFFDSQIKVMASKIDEQLNELIRHRPTEVKYFVLSGGFGSSRYVQRELRRRYPSMEILCAVEPQLAVAKGLVMDRVQTLTEGVGIYTGKCSRVSYGVICSWQYNPKVHNGELVQKDPIDGKIYAKEQIDWIIKQGEQIPDKGFLRPFRLKISKDSGPQAVEVVIVMSRDPAGHLPSSLRRGSVQKVCRIKATIHDFSTFPQKRSLFWPGRSQHYVADFYLLISVGSTDLAFDILSPQETRLSTNVASLTVEWLDDVEPLPDKPLPAPRFVKPRFDG